ncbi:carbon monoxide dehydrogenase subunit G [Siccirubricoccus sp. KC 17139]|uniref:Carbon monoxide dehydrogenase subunit G n=1 Tax=Siccirubricoccus soli TaxID=2899147 RepID=A0ABT1D7V9_9PROT|nr:carbon monoxide dehydrogenase subunit G [Siccirubricoccus soli]MCO6417692.1 carbon monoxide dehydrogenase subunit G [Siccirubricoccus soli]MCP2683827.1 carbon monoxide dehydrogenase subunit G [Siccirubricoccus soli]
MEMTGERRIPAPRQQVWEALNDPEALRAAIPGCESVERTAEDQFQARVAVKLGPMAAKFGGKVKLENINPPESYTITGEGNGGAMGFAKGGADVALEELSASETLLKYQVKAQVGGKMAQLGARLIDSTAKQMADQFFDRFAANLTPVPTTAEAMGATTAAPARADVGVTETPRSAPEDAANAAGMAATRSPANAAATSARVEAARHGGVAAGTDTEYLDDAGAPGPLTQHGAEGPSAGGGKPVYRPNPRPVAPEALTPMRLLLHIEPFGLPLQFWGGSLILLVILALMFL